MHEHGLAQIDTNCHDVTEWAHLRVRRLVARLIVLQLVGPVLERPLTVTGCSVFEVRDQVRGRPLSGRRGRGTDRDSA